MKAEQAAATEYPADSASDANKAVLLIFRLSGEAFALPVNGVYEILDPIAATRMPGAPEFACELINVRGSIAPLFDLRQRLGMPPARPGESGRFIVLELPVSGEPTRLAITADSVDEVIESDPDSFEPIPELGARWPERFIHGICTHQGRLVVLLDAQAVFAPEQPSQEIGAPT